MGRAWWLVLLVVIAAWYLTLAPTSLGGPLTLVVTRGDSMEPAFTAGDLAVAYRDGSLTPGEIAVAPHPTGPLVVHRIVAIDSDGLLTQGDNVSRPDAWRTGPEQVLGTVRFRIPGFWRLLAVLTQPLVMGAMAAAAVLCIRGLRRPGSSASPAATGPAVALLLAVLVAPPIGQGTTASLQVDADDLLLLTREAPFDSYPDTPAEPGPCSSKSKGKKPNCP